MLVLIFIRLTPVRIRQKNEINLNTGYMEPNTSRRFQKRLSRRHNTINGEWVQRDLYSAFLLMNSDDTLKHADRDKAFRIILSLKQCITNALPRSYGPENISLPVSDLKELHNTIHRTITFSYTQYIEQKLQFLFYIYILNGSN